MSPHRLLVSCLFHLLLLCLQKEALGNASDALDSIAGYKPQNDMVDLLSLDLDQEAMEARLLANSDAGLKDAQELYSQGAHSLSVATVKLALPLSRTLKAGTELNGEDDYNHKVSGTVYEDALMNDMTLKFKYSVMHNSSRVCQVGALPVEKQVVNGCLTRKNTLDVVSTGEMLAYTYDPFTDNDNGRTLQKLSFDAKQKFYECKNCPYETFLKFREYYGKSTYADEWITAAFEGRSTDLSNGKANFELHSLEGRSEAIKKGVTLLTIWMYVVGLMDEAMFACQPSCSSCNVQATRSWDEAVALYTGSLEGTDGSGNGLFLYDHADKRCSSFRTCGRTRDLDTGTSAVNVEIFDLFQSAQLDISNGLCDSARVHKERIMQLMRVPLVQGALYYAYVNEKQQHSSEKEEALAAVYAASVLPLICNDADATSIWEMMALGSSMTNFVKVKAALERNYHCLAVTCLDVGGIYDSTSRSYYEGASPCTTDGSINNSVASVNIGMIVGIVVGAVVALLFLTCCCLPLRRRKLLKKGKVMPPLEVSQAEQDREYQQQLDEEFQRQLAEVERKEALMKTTKTDSKYDPEDNETEALTLTPASNVKSLVTVFDNSLV